MKKQLLSWAALLALVLQLPVSAQRYKNASYFIGDDLKDEPFAGLTEVVQSSEISFTVSIGNKLHVGIDDVKPSTNEILNSSLVELPYTTPNSIWWHTDAIHANLFGHEPAVYTIADTDQIRIFKSSSNQDLNVSGTKVYDSYANLINQNLNLYAPRFRLRKGDFDSREGEELLFGYLSSPKQLNFVGLRGQNGTDQLASATGHMSIGLETLYYDFYLSDFDLDGISELVVVKEYLKPNNRLGVLCQIYRMKQSGWQLANEVTLIEDLADAYSMQLAITTGDMNGDQVPEIIVTTAHNRPNIPDVYVLEVFDDTETETVDFLEHFTVTSSIKSGFYNSYGTEIIDIATGDLNGNGKDEFVLGFATSGNIKVTAFWLDNTGALKCHFEESGGNQIVQPYYYSPGRFLEVADVNGDGKAEVVMAHYVSSPQDYSGSYIRKWIYTLPYTSQPWVKLTEQDQKFATRSTSHAPMSIVAIDLDNDAIRLGKPKYYEKSEIQRPLVILNAPPTHFDILNDEIFNINSCYDEGEGCDGFSATYTKTTTSDFMVETETTSDWAVSANAEASASAWVASAEASIGKKYGEGFSAFKFENNKVSISSGSIASEDDRIFVNLINYGIYEYPMYRRDTLIGHLMSVMPQVSSNEWISTKSRAATNFFPSHEVGNILSYKNYPNDEDKNKLDLNKNPRLAETIALQASGYLVDGSSNHNWNVDLEKISGLGSSKSWQSSLNVSASASVGGSFAGFGAELKVSVEGEYNKGGISTQNISITSGINLDVSLGSLNTSIGEVGYTITPYMYWANNGALVVDYAVRPELPAIGDPNTWWSQHYGLEQDPALMLPWRYDTEKGSPPQEETRKTQSKSILFDSNNPKQGDTINIYTQINNWSLLPTESPVKVSFFNGDPNNGGTLLTNTNGQTVVSTYNSIPARGSELVTFEWEVSNDMGGYTRIYAYIDPEDEMTEIHETNNLGWSSIIVDGVPTDIDKEQDTTNKGKLLSVAPNPTTGQSTVSFSLKQASNVHLSLYNLQGSLLKHINYDDLSVGKHQHIFDLNELPQGIYLVRLMMEGHQESIRLMKM